MGIHVMKTEYSIFHKYLEWDEYNSIVKNTKPLLKADEVFINWRINLLESFDKIDVKLLSIPFSIPHEKYLDFMNKFIIG